MSGFVIAQDNVQTCGNYLGIARFTTWPLAQSNNELTQSLSRNVFLQSINAPLPLTLPVTSADLLVAYLERCHDLGLKTKLFYLDTFERSLPPNIYGNSLGWDYIASLDLSYINDDGSLLFSMFPQKLSDIKARMTPFGLFGSRKDAEQYAAIRKSLDCENFGIEYNGEEFYAETFQISPTAFLNVH